MQTLALIGTHLALVANGAFVARLDQPDSHERILRSQRSGHPVIRAQGETEVLGDLEENRVNRPLNARVREQIALAVAEINDCTYCRSAHTYIGGKVGLSEREIADARQVVATDDRTAAILDLARSIVVQRGELSDTEFKAARAAKLTDAEIIETTTNVALNLLTNYVNHVAQTVVDFPEVKSGEVETAAEVCATSCGCGH